MSDEVCTSAEAISALGYLRHSFGGWEIPEQEQRSHLRTFRKFTPNEVRDAIESLKGQQRRPSPSDIEGAVLAERKATRKAAGPYLDANDPELTPPDVVPERVAELREVMFIGGRISGKTAATAFTVGIMRMWGWPITVSTGWAA